MEPNNYLECELKNFHENCLRLMYAQEYLEIISGRLNGDIQGVSVKTVIYENAKDPYRDNKVELMYEEAEAMKERDYYLFAVHRVAKLLQKLSAEEVEILILRYEKNLPISAVAQALNYKSVSWTYKKINQILTKMEEMENE